MVASVIYNHGYLILATTAIRKQRQRCTLTIPAVLQWQAENGSNMWHANNTEHKRKSYSYVGVISIT
jgi:hypothetical protein